MPLSPACRAVYVPPMPSPASCVQLGSGVVHAGTPVADAPAKPNAVHTPLSSEATNTSILGSSGVGEGSTWRAVST
jgi:hypothetical protein